MKETTLFLLTQIDIETAILDSISTDPVVDESLVKINYLTQLIRELLG